MWKKFGSFVQVHDCQQIDYIEIITVKDAQKILLQVAPVATYLFLTFFDKSSTVYFVKVGSFVYKVTEGLDETLELLAVNTAKLEQIRLYFNTRLQAKTIARLISQNKYPQVCVNQEAVNELCEKTHTFWWFFFTKPVLLDHKHVYLV